MGTVGEFTNFLEDLNLISIIIRIFLSMVCGGVIGIERGRAHQAAGMRTYMLVCMGATMVMMTGQYVHSFSDRGSGPSGGPGGQRHRFFGSWKYHHSRKDENPRIDHSGRAVDGCLYWT